VTLRRWEWTGVYYDGRTARREPVIVTVGPLGLRLQRSDGTTVEWPFAGLRQTQGSFASEQVRIEFGTNPVEALLVEQEGLREAIGDVAPAVMRRLQARRNTPKIVAWCLGALGAASAAYVWGAPLLADSLAPKVPVSWEASFGRTALDELAPARERCGDSAALADLRVVVDRLRSALPASSYDFRVSVVRDSAINAFAMPGGFIIVNSGLLGATKTPEELAGVLAHEMQHVAHRHTTRAVIREAPLRIALSALSGGGAEIGTAANVAGTLGVLRYRRGDEAEADRDGIRLLAAARVDPSGMVAFMRTLEARHEDAPRVVGYLSTHPHTANRVKALEALEPRGRGEWKPVLSKQAWERVRGVCADEVEGAQGAEGREPTQKPTRK
jgi:Zn-dependent protease with chaperone function